MNPREIGMKRPEAIIQSRIVDFLTLRGWYTRSTHGSAYQSGFPDLYCAHLKFGTRWVEVKNPENYSFTSAQLEVFPKLSAFGVGIWILIAATPEEYAKLFRSANWHLYYLRIK